MYKILISGYYGFNNIGDESILRTVIDNLREKLPDVDITVLSQDPEQTAEKFGVKSVRRMSLPDIFRAVGWCDLLLSGALHGQFGRSFKYKADVLEVIGGRAGNTLILGGIGFLLIFGLSLLLGVFCAWFEDRLPDRALCRVGTAVSCIPEFWLALVLILLFAVSLRLLPSSGAYSVGKADDWGDRALHLVLPMAVVVIDHLWYYAYMIRNKLLEEVRADYVLLARSKGMGKRQVLFRHCLRNILPSYLSIMAISVPHILGGAYIIETVFSYPGLGTLSYESARYHDYNLLMVLSMLSGVIVILCSILAQILNEQLDPRMRSPQAPGAGEEGGHG